MCSLNVGWLEKYGRFLRRAMVINGTMDILDYLKALVDKDGNGPGFDLHWPPPINMG